MIKFAALSMLYSAFCAAGCKCKEILFTLKILTFEF
jgi:hypothetical protein